MLTEAQFETVAVDDVQRHVFIIDLNKGHRSVTNDAERVVAVVNWEHPDYRIFYRDTMGRWDELVHQHGTFLRFAPGAHA